MMHKLGSIAIVLTLTGAASATSKIEFILETGGDNHADLYEAGRWPQFSSGVTDDSLIVGMGEDLTWAVRVLVHGAYNEVNPGDNLHVDLDPITGEPGPGHGKYPLGLAKVAFDLVVTDMADNVIAVGHGGPDVAGFHSTINDGDADGSQGVEGQYPDSLENGAFASVFNIRGNGANGGRVIDRPVDGGPNMDAYTYPSVAGWPAESTAPPGYLIGFGAGCSSFDFGGDYVPGVGMAGPLGPPEIGCGDGLVPLYGDLHPEPQPLFEGQIHIGYPEFQELAAYKLKVIADPEDSEILHGDINCAAQTFGADSFATPVNEVITDEITFRVTWPPEPRPEIVGRHLFYNNSYYDGNNAGIDLDPNAGTNHDHDDDAIDPGKSPLLPGMGLAQPTNWTGYIKGINGLMFDLVWLQAPVTADDFTFTNLGRLGTGNTPVTPSGFAVRPGAGIGGSDRVVITFPDGLLVDGWLKVEIGTGFGLAAPDVCWWGDVRANAGTYWGGYIPVNATDMLVTRDNTHLVPGSAPVDDLVDYNKDGFVNATDILYCRDHPKLNPMTAVGRIVR